MAATEAVPKAANSVKDNFNGLPKSKKILVIIASILFIIALIVGTVFIIHYIRNKGAAASLHNAQSMLHSSSHPASSNATEPKSTTAEVEGDTLPGNITGEKPTKKPSRKGKKGKGTGKKPKASTSTPLKGKSEGSNLTNNLLGINDVRLINMRNALVEKAEEARKALA